MRELRRLESTHHQIIKFKLSKNRIHYFSSIICLAEAQPPSHTATERRNFFSSLEHPKLNAELKYIWQFNDDNDL